MDDPEAAALSSGGSAVGAGEGSSSRLRERSLVIVFAICLLFVTAYGLADTYVASDGIRSLFFALMLVGIVGATASGIWVLKPAIRRSETAVHEARRDRFRFRRKTRERVRELEEYAHELEQANEDLQRFAQVASHDLKEPVRMVSSYLQLLDERYGDELDEEAREYMGFAVHGAHRLNDLIDGLLAYARAGSRDETFQRTDLGTVLDDAISNLGMAIAETDATIHAGDLPEVHGDPAQLTQVFQNLLSNALKFHGDEPPRIHVSAAEEDDRWVVTVRDHGIGFDSDREHRIFDIFQRAHKDGEGHGVGLAVCKRIVDRHRGEIWAEAKPGDGARFRFTLPKRGESDPPPEPKPRKPPETLEERTQEII